MAASVLCMRGRTQNPSELKTYAETARVAMEGHAVTPCAV